MIHSSSGDTDMIAIDEALVARARALAETMASEGTELARIKVADNATLVVAKEESSLSIVLKSIETESGSTYYIGFGQLN